MTVLLYSHPACLQHNAGLAHPESPSRLKAVLQALRAAGLPGLQEREAPRVQRDQLQRVHTPDHIEHIFAAEPETGDTHLDADTAMSPGSLEAALRAAGAACAAVDAVLADEARRAFCAVRPPGHHATADTAMGFCLFNNIAVAAAHALHAHGLERVAIADFDVHHGNGTEDIFADEPRVQFLSSHQMPLYPGSGSPGMHRAHIHNGALLPGSDSSAFRKLWREQLLPAIDAFAPQMVFISAGFDADWRDPLAQIELVPDDYAWITHELCALADRHAEGRAVSALEGGYDLQALAEDSVAHVRAMTDSG